MTEPGSSEEHLRAPIIENLHIVLNNWKNFVDQESIISVDGSFTFEVEMGLEHNPAGEKFIQACGFLSQFGVSGVEFPYDDSEDDEELTIEQISNMKRTRRVSINPDLLTKHLASM